MEGQNIDGFWLDCFDSQCYRKQLDNSWFLQLYLYDNFNPLVKCRYVIHDPSVTWQLKNA